MHYLFEPVPLHNELLLWVHKRKTEADFSGYYHWHQCCEILMVHEGSGTVIVNQKTFEIRRGMVFFFQPFQLHKVSANVSRAQPYIRSNIHFEPYEVEDKLRPFPMLHALLLQLWQGNQSLQAFDMGETTFDYIEQVLAVHERNAPAAEGNREAALELSSLLVMQVLNAISPHLEPRQAKQSNGMLPRTFTYAEKVMQWVEEHYKEDIRLEDIAEAMHLSKYYLSRLFQNETGSGIPQYVTARRIKIACRLLQTTSLPIERIGIEVGIPNPSYFIRIFKKTVGTTPLKYRKDR
ncbi:AraC family transcriptional regulator [Paenibacillus sp.]|uniref:AraC family transcriptional regulator n=1 Tax=Paenibacillus sp. TaxID=58172 RepID=UPI002D44E73A|nr:AraC family transcriptional regulator [Paenibacillus sp.]HZG86464.1 AraC family transcriptional regulator [Paenibacillus sp.]